MARYSVDPSEFLPGWFGEGALCYDMANKIDDRNFEASKIIGPVLLHQLDPAQRAVRSIFRMYNGLQENEQNDLRKDLRNKHKNPFFSELPKNYSPNRKYNFERVAKLICAECPLIDDCRDYGLTTGLKREGVYGGLNNKERKLQAMQQAS